MFFGHRPKIKKMILCHWYIQWRPGPEVYKGAPQGRLGVVRDTIHELLFLRGGAGICVSAVKGGARTRCRFVAPIKQLYDQSINH